MARRLRVASIYSTLFIGGDTNRLLAYMAARDRDRFEHIVVIGMSALEELEHLIGPMWSKFRALDVETVDLGIPGGQLRWRRASAINRTADQLRTLGQLIHKTARILREREVDIVDGRVDIGTVVGTLAGRLAGVKAVVSTNYGPQFSRFRSGGLFLLGQGVYALVDAVICDSVAYLDAMCQWMLLPPRGYCIPNGIDPPVAERPKNDLAIELGIPPGAKVVAQIANLRPDKGQDLLLEAAPVVLAQQPDAFFLVVGYTGDTQARLAYRKRLDDMVLRQGVGGRARIVAYPGSIGDIWSLVDVHVHPTRLDSSPVALLEGMSLGKPAVTTRIGGVPELVVDGQTGIIVPPDDVGALAAAILRLLQDPGEASRLGRNARQRYEARYTPQVMARRIEAVFEHVVANPRFRREPSG